ncbi:MAG: DNA cytosine methyltransferase [Gammaproteobacteria bacterium]|uniref:DNA cytosine methyltransferase n=1 Tax=Candidatus Kutchimonas denitrificans TaxID=3056748 RepID=A0AAE5CAP6_9BACT|nr:DNA cytosine methyltransferase [Candidatus Kutchimonas denitrificans]NIV53552.1 DNA cytosine methyltransferase [Gammaproteobacteria bacterium]
MSERLVVLDLFCGAGGAAMGYHRAGFDVVGIDIEPQPNFPFAFIQADALEPPVDLTALDLIHASPPCQAYTPMSNRWRGSGGLADERPDLIGAVRQMLELGGVPYVIENVPGAPLACFIRLTGEMFGLSVHRPRLFECHPFLMGPAPERRQRDPVAVYGKHHDGRLLWTRKDGTELRAPDNLEEPSEAMGIDWMTWDELKESIPPAYTEYIGRQMKPLLEQAA